MVENSKKHKLKLAIDSEPSSSNEKNTSQSPVSEPRNSYRKENDQVSSKPLNQKIVFESDDENSNVDGKVSSPSVSGTLGDEDSSLGLAMPLKTIEKTSDAGHVFDKMPARNSDAGIKPAWNQVVSGNSTPEMLTPATGVWICNSHLL